MKQSYRSPLILLCAILSFGLGAGVVRADIVTFTANLSGLNEVPPVVTAATGFATITLDTDGGFTVPLHLEFSGLSSAQTAVHIHQGAAGVNGPPVITLPLGSPVDTDITLNLPLYAALAGEQLYLNVHSANFPGGEIRGQFILTSTVADEDTAWGAIKALYR